MSLFKSAFTVGGFTLLSRILGYIRDILIAATLGAGLVADAFFVAFRLPNFFRTLSAEGAFNAAFVPLFSGKLSSDGKEKALKFAENVFAFMLIFLLGLTAIMQIFMPAIMHVLAPGFTDNPTQFELAVFFARVTFPYLIFISLVSLFSGMLNSIGKFAAAAAAPIFLNICMILALAVFANYTKTPAHALSYAVTIAGMVQLIWLVIAAKKHGLTIKLKRPEANPQVKMLLKRMIPGIIGGGVTQINLWVNTVIATTMASAVSYLYYADRMVQFPLAIIGTAMGTALLPALSKQIKGRKFKEASLSQNKALEIVLLLTIPSAIAFMVIAENLIMVMFERGQFGASETTATANALIAYAFGLPAFVMIKIFAPVFFASGDTKTPVKIALVCLIINVAISLTLIQYIGHIGLAVSTSVTAWVNTSLLAIVLTKRGLYHIDKNLNKRLFKILLSAIFMGVILYYVQNFMASYFAAGFLIKISALFALIVVGMVSFFATAHACKACCLGDLRGMVR